MNLTDTISKILKIFNKKRNFKFYFIFLCLNSEKHNTTNITCLNLIFNILNKLFILND